ncbi:sigma-70 family RNA polymerase sigma factor [Reichenbachiella sp.]|uniref:RNA polymerase sigma factor n=1 Tax=Reichenbachiella sp. TaxID=2184521 RepID=UPI003297A848
MPIPDETLLSKIRSNDYKKRNKALEYLYDTFFKSIKSFVLNNSGSEEDAQDVFQDGIAIVFQNVLQNKFKKEASLNTYTYSICKNLWLMKIRKNSKITEVDILGEVEVEDVKNEYVSLQRLEKIINELNPDCQRVLKAFYFESKSMEEIQRLFGLGSIQATKNKKLRCMKHLMQLISKKKLAIKDFVE